MHALLESQLRVLRKLQHFFVTSIFDDFSPQGWKVRLCAKLQFIQKMRNEFNTLNYVLWIQCGKRPIFVIWLQSSKWDQFYSFTHFQKTSKRETILLHDFSFSSKLFIFQFLHALELVDCMAVRIFITTKKLL